MQAPAGVAGWSIFQSLCVVVSNILWTNAGDFPSAEYSASHLIFKELLRNLIIF